MSDFETVCNLMKVRGYTFTAPVRAAIAVHGHKAAEAMFIFGESDSIEDAQAEVDLFLAGLEENVV